MHAFAPPRGQHVLREVALQGELAPTVLALVRLHEVWSPLATARLLLVLAQLVLLRELALAPHALEAARAVLVTDVLHQVVLDGEDLVTHGARVGHALVLLAVLQVLMGCRQVALLST